MSDVRCLISDARLRGLWRAVVSFARITVQYLRIRRHQIKEACTM
jgi:hypothetical protein